MSTDNFELPSPEDRLSEKDRALWKKTMSNISIEDQLRQSLENERLVWEVWEEDYKNDIKELEEENEKLKAKIAELEQELTKKRSAKK